ncbi:kappaPI-actitoxin-Avd3d-like [Centruroides sculpturatus]|uniref:kappaPI-actitoxin-Avd3d-like n=1 Tax=Centruroides sculpturatus TaxID=218467 RepID=UPI000C6EA894|nr:kappaPI-actitoxin-Avd3d-like [Centruroides sculpturatus]
MITGSCPDLSIQFLIFEGQFLYSPNVYADCCMLEKDKGLCLAIFPSYFYNANSSRCEEFNYGGCGGNCNRFPNLIECCETCGGGNCVEETTPLS